MIFFHFRLSAKFSYKPEKEQLAETRCHIPSGCMGTGGIRGLVHLAQMDSFSFSESDDVSSRELRGVALTHLRLRLRFVCSALGGI